MNLFCSAKVVEVGVLTSNSFVSVVLQKGVLSAVQTQILARIYLTGWVDGRMDRRMVEHMDAQSPFAVLTGNEA